MRSDGNSTEDNLTSKLIFSLQRSSTYNFMFLEHRPFSMATFKMLSRCADMLRAGPDSNFSSVIFCGMFNCAVLFNTSTSYI